MSKIAACLSEASLRHWRRFVVRNKAFWGSLSVLSKFSCFSTFVALPLIPFPLGVRVWGGKHRNFLFLFAPRPKSRGNK